MAKIRYIIVDDEDSASVFLRSVLEKWKEFEYINSFRNPNNAIKYLESKKIDLVFMDEEFPYHKLGHLWIGKIPCNTEIVIITGSSIRINEASTFDCKNRILSFFNKPACANQIDALLHKYRYIREDQDTNKKEERKFLADKKIEKVKPNDGKFLVAYLSEEDLKEGRAKKILYINIVYVESAERHSLVYTVDKSDPLIIPLKISDLKDMLLPDFRFVELGRRRIISIQNTTYKGGAIISKYTEAVIPIPRRIWDILRNR